MRLLAIALALFFQVSETIEVSIVNVDVRVTDRDGKFVRRLTKDDFEVFEDGKRVEITNFAEYAEEPQGGGNVEASVPAAQQAATAPPPRTIVVFVDRFHIPQKKADELFGSLKSMLHQAVRPGDHVMIVAWVYRLYTRLGFTDDLTAIDGTLDELAKGRTFGFDASQRDVDLGRQWEAEADAFIASKNGGGSGGDDTIVPLDGLEAATREYNDLKAKTAALAALLDSMVGAPGQKSMICLTRRWSMIAGLEYLRGRRAMAMPPKSRELMFRATDLIEHVARSANVSGVKLYMLYPAGLSDEWVQAADDASQPSPTASAIAGATYQTWMNESVALRHVADLTGGMSATGQSDVVKLLPAIENDLGSYYSLAYRATMQGKDRARRIVVRTKNPAYRVRSQKEVVEQSDATKMKARVAGVLFGVPEAMRIPLRVALGERVKTSRNRFRVPLTIQIPIASLTTLSQRGKQHGAFTVYFAASDALGGISEVTEKTQPFDLQDAARAQQGHFTYELTVETEHLTRRIAVGVYDDVSHEFGLQRIDVP
jgi:VWFA-related protein